MQLTTNNSQQLAIATSRNLLVTAYFLHQTFFCIATYCPKGPQVYDPSGSYSSRPVSIFTVFYL